MRILVFDPGEHIGWVFFDTEMEYLIGGTTGDGLHKDVSLLIPLFDAYTPEVVVYETFNLYAGAASHLVNNDFYTCQVIGAIKLLCHQRGITRIVAQSPGVKKFSGGLDNAWKAMEKIGGKTEHIKDAYLHLKYFLTFNKW